MTKAELVDGFYNFPCPHCNGTIIVKENEINCAIFRHAILKKNGKQINPHASKEKCDSFIEKKLVYGCAKPYRMVKVHKGWKVEKCDYI